MANRKLVLGALGLCGCASLYWFPVKPVAGLSETQLRLAQSVQPVILTVIALFVGDRYARRVGFGTSLIDHSGKALTASAVGKAIAVGFATAALSLVLYWAAKPILPAAFIEAAAAFEPPLVVRLLYGGLTEEILVRWGLMSWLLWLLARVSKREMPSHWPAGTWTAATVAALIFGAAHLPMAFSLAGQAGGPLTAYIIAANFPIGLAAGVAFARYGIELAMLVHAAAGLTLGVLS